MNVGNIQEYKLEIGGKKYTFRMNFKALVKFNERYRGYKTEPLKDSEGNVVIDKENGKPKMVVHNAIDIFNDCINGRDQYGSLVKILSCCCKEKDFTEDELLESLSFDFPTMKILDLITNNMIQGSLTLSKGNSREDKTKN